MKAMLLNQICDLSRTESPLTMAEWEIPEPGQEELLLQVLSCGVCHTELDEIEGRTPPPAFPIIPGHQVVGRVVKTGEKVTHHQLGARVGVGWIYSACGQCEFCRKGEENLCARFRATGRDHHGGYAEYMVVPQNSAIPIPGTISDAEAAPLLCAGAIGYRSFNLLDFRAGQSLGLMGFGASAHLVLKMVRHLFPDTRVSVFARSESERTFAMEIGAYWSGDIDQPPPERLHGIIDTTPAWKPVVCSLKALQPGGRLVINAIRKESADQDALMSLNYETHLWEEKEIKSVANVTRSDISEFLDLAASIPLKPEAQEFSLEDANKALLELKNRKIRGAKILRLASG